jgi:hypothetical protein
VCVCVRVTDREGERERGTWREWGATLGHIGMRTYLATSYRMYSLSIEYVLLLQNVFSYYRICSYAHIPCYVRGSGIRASHLHRVYDACVCVCVCVCVV